MRFQSMVVLAAVCAGLSGCATAVNPRRTHSVLPPNGGSRVKMTRLVLENTGPVLSVFDVENGDTPLQIRDFADHDKHVEMCRVFADNPLGDPPGMVTVSSNCMNSILIPYVELPKSGRHTLRLVRSGREITVTVKASTHWQWFWLNGLCFPLVWACWGVDIALGSWSYYGDLDVTQAFLHPSRSASATAPRSNQ